MKRQATDWEKKFVKCVSNKELVSIIYKEFSKLNKNKSNLKMGKSFFLTGTLPMNIYEWQAGT